MSDNRREALEALRDKVKAGDISDTGVDRFSAVPKRGGGVYADPNWYDAHAAYWRGSLNAAINLLERALPGWDWLVSNEGKHAGEAEGPVASLLRHDLGPMGHFVCSGETPARALLLSILSALISETPKGETP